MQRTITFTLIGLVCVSCDSTYSISASGPISAHLEQKCVIETLQMEKTVRTAKGNEHNPQQIVVELIVPQVPEGNAYASLEERRTPSGQLELSLMLNSFRRPTPEYQSYVQMTLEGLRDRTIERCSGK